ncbi:MAG: hypothetical protein WD335_03490 [Candidatus Paceibacterota bacterium]
MKTCLKKTTVGVLTAAALFLFTPITKPLQAHTLNPDFYEQITGKNIQEHIHPTSSASIKNLDEDVVPYKASETIYSTLSESDREEILSEFPEYGSRKIEQTYLTLPEWYQVYSYNEFADYLQQGGYQKDFPFMGSLKNFWSYYRIALGESKDEDFNWSYNFVTWMIGANLSVEYSVKFIYENTVGTFTQLFTRDKTEADIFIANSWNNYAERMYQTTWYHYPYFDDLKNIWKETPLFNKNFIRNLERKIAFSTSYLIKGTYAKAWLLLGTEKDNETFSFVYTTKRDSLENKDMEILKEIGDNKYIIKTERYGGFKDALLQLLEANVQFLEIQGHEVISLSYLSDNQIEPFENSREIKMLDKRELFYNPDGYYYRVTIEAPVQNLNSVIETIELNKDKFEMIYDF